MKSLALYIDKWYILGAVITDGVARPMALPNREDRVWLYFYESPTDDTIAYGKGFQRRFRDNALHYYGDVFAHIALPSATYTHFGKPQPLRGIFKEAGVFDDLRKVAEAAADDRVPVCLAFAEDITPAARLVFAEELDEARFDIVESAARIGHLALEHTSRLRGGMPDGIYLALDACNENLHYALYQRGGGLFVRTAAATLHGYGADARRRALCEHVVDNINRTSHAIENNEEREAECLRMAQFADNWLAKLGAARTAIPVQLPGITLSKDPYRDYAVRVQRAEIDSRTEVIVQDTVRVVAKFVRDNGVRHDQLQGIVMLGNTFTNTQYRNTLGNTYNLPDEQMPLYPDADLPVIVGVYEAMDCGQFSATTETIKAEGEIEIIRIKNAEEEARLAQIAKQKADEAKEQAQKEEAKERNFQNAKQKGYEAERQHNYSDMEYYFRSALDYYPEDTEAKEKRDEAVRLKAKEEVLASAYREKISQAKLAAEQGDWETAKQKAEEALGSRPNDGHATKIKADAERRIKHAKQLSDYLIKADIFIEQKAYRSAKETLAKARVLDVDKTEIDKRDARIKLEEEQRDSTIAEKKAKLEETRREKLYDEAIKICYELAAIDTEGAQQWNLVPAEIRVEQERTARVERECAQLVKEIDDAVWKDEWQNAVDLCKKVLGVDPDNEDIKTKLQRAQKELDRQRPKPHRPAPKPTQESPVRRSDKTDDGFFTTPTGRRTSHENTDKTADTEFFDRPPKTPRQPVPARAGQPQEKRRITNDDFNF